MRGVKQFMLKHILCRFTFISDNKVRIIHIIHNPMNNLINFIIYSCVQRFKWFWIYGYAGTTEYCGAIKWFLIKLINVNKNALRYITNWFDVHLYMYVALHEKRFKVTTPWEFPMKSSFHTPYIKKCLKVFLCQKNFCFCSALLKVYTLAQPFFFT